MGPVIAGMAIALWGIGAFTFNLGMVIVATILFFVSLFISDPY